ncbi:NAD-dependent epimerase/dehydratase family protein [Phycisphaerales bacterium AB-hyl4]|uniref:NAD-dependent epimerase/dehydratase family protein n=1 Tax=Natronomicrosphaera hydrolytica TaxID=3242702 RepID=A0ABV4UA21_9BACT
MQHNAPQPPRTALVTGATGFTGGHLARTLANRGWCVRALVRDSDRAAPLQRDGIDTIVGNLTHRDDVRRAAAGCTHIFHIAALYRSAKHPDRVYHDVNVNGTRHVLDAAREHNVARTVHCSTVGVHGDIDQLPADENAPFKPGDIYQQTKLEAELLARDAFNGNQPGSIFRPVGIYGPGDLRFLKLFRMIHTGRFRMFGQGNIHYHLTYINDLVDGIILCGTHPAALGQTYILAGPRHTTIRELADHVAHAVGRPPTKGSLPLTPLKLAATACEILCRPFNIEPPLHHRRLDFFTKSRGFSDAKARRELGYQPKVDLPEGLTRTAAWYFQHNYLKPSRPIPIKPTDERSDAGGPSSRTSTTPPSTTPSAPSTYSGPFP